MLTSKGFATVVDLNLNGTFNMCKAAFDGYMGEHGGRIVTIVAETRNGLPRAMHTVEFPPLFYDMCGFYSCISLPF